MDKTEYWDKRAETYNSLRWVRDKDALGIIMGIISPGSDDLVLDVGTGTGAMACMLAPHVKQVIGIDKSRGMLDHATHADDVYYVEWDACKPLFAPKTFDKVVMRQVAHHIPDNALQGMIGVYNRVLRPGGRMYVIQAVCPAESIREEYGKILRLKDRRNVLSASDIQEVMINAGFGNVEVHGFVDPGFSVVNWLSNNALEEEVRDKLFEMHVTASKEFKEVFGMKIINGDCLINIQNVIVVGERA